MATFQYLNKDKLEKKDLAFDLKSDDVSVPAVHQVVKALLASRRQGNASTKNKSLVSGGGKKPFKQKGTGRARQGSTRSPLMPGGGTAHGPIPRSFEQKINKKLYLKALKSMLADKFQSNALVIAKELSFSGKTKEISNFLNDKKINSSLIVCSSPDNMVIRACRNLPNVKAVPVGGLSVYDMVKFNHLIIDEESMSALMKRIG
jgi:large subunit ribosomal protein L4